MGRVARHQFAQSVDLAIGHAQDPADIAQHRPRLQFAERDDLCDPLGAVFALHIADHLVAPVLAEIDVEIRHRYPLRVQKPLEQQAKPQRIEVGDRQGPGDRRAGPRAASRPDRNAGTPRPLDEIGNDQEIAGKPHLGDRRQLEFQPFAIGSGLVLGEPEAREAAVEAGVRGTAQRRRLVDPVLGRKGRQDRLARLRDERAAAGDHECIVASLREIGENLAHLRRRPEVVVRGQPLAVGVGNHLALSDAEQRILRFPAIPVEKMRVVGGDERQVVAIGETDQPLLAAGLLAAAVPHQLDIEPSRERRSQLGERRLGRLALPFGKRPADRTLRPAR